MESSEISITQPTQVLGAGAGAGAGQTLETGARIGGIDVSQQINPCSPTQESNASTKNYSITALHKDCHPEFTQIFTTYVIEARCRLPVKKPGAGFYLFNPNDYNTHRMKYMEEILRKESFRTLWKKLAGKGLDFEFLDKTSQEVDIEMCAYFKKHPISGEVCLLNMELTHLPSIFMDPDCCKGITSLSLEFNQLSSLPERIFSGLTALKSLNLAHNALRSLPAKAFSGLTHLEFLFLGLNQLQSLPKKIFSDLINLKVLEVYANRLTSLTK